MTYLLDTDSQNNSDTIVEFAGSVEDKAAEGGANKVVGGPQPSGLGRRRETRNWRTERPRRVSVPEGCRRRMSLRAPGCPVRE